MAISLSDSSAGPSSGASRYHVLAPLAVGGMANLELALQVSSGGFERLVVLKRVRPHLSEFADVSEMFLEESRIAARLSHPNLIHAYEVGRDGAGLFLAMEYLSGQTFRAIADAAGYSSLDFSFTLEVLIATLNGLDYAHHLADIAGRPMGLVHRDISPSNVFVTYSGQVKVLDFGIAKAHSSSVHTETGVLKGKVSYMAPEQAMAGGGIDARADLYAVGVMLWEAIAGRRRWGDLHEVAILRELTQGADPPSPGARSRGLPELADVICQRALAFEPTDRFESAAVFRNALEQLALVLGPRPTPRQIGEAVSGRFEVERTREQQIVERQLELVKQDSGSRRAATPKRLPSIAGTKVFSVPPPASMPSPASVPPAAEAASAPPASSSAVVALSPRAAQDAETVVGRRSFSSPHSRATLVLVAGLVTLSALAIWIARPYLQHSAATRPSNIAVASTGAASEQNALVGAEPAPVPPPPLSASTSATTSAPPPPSSSAATVASVSADHSGVSHKKLVPRAAAAGKAVSHAQAPASSSAKRSGVQLDRGSPWGE